MEGEPRLFIRGTEVLITPSKFIVWVDKEKGEEAAMKTVAVVLLYLWEEGWVEEIDSREVLVKFKKNEKII